VVSVTNSLGPPALWLRLEAQGTTLTTDEAWQVSLAGATWEYACGASQAFSFSRGNPLYGSELLLDSLRRVWPVLGGLLLVFLLLVMFVKWWTVRRPFAFAGPTAEQWPWCLFAVVLTARLVLSIHNLLLLPPTTGFDVKGHQAYIRFILDNSALPLPQEGWETHQPPLYYAASALLLGLVGLTPEDDSGILLLHGVNALIGLLQSYLLLLCLRRLFPQNFAIQGVGLVAGAFLPPALYLSQFVTNEVLAALFVTIAIYLSLIALRTEKESLLLFVAIGAVLGAAMLTKFSSVLAVPVLCLALIAPLRAKGKPSFSQAAGRVSAVLLSCLIVCAWHYARVWMEGRKSLLPGSEADPAMAWWQDPGFRTSAYYANFGQALIRPLFSGSHSFGDAIYSTLFGDGLAGGAARVASRPPWNYDFMNAAYLLALVPCTLLVVGLVVSIARLPRQAEPGWLIVSGLVCLFGLGVLYFSLRAPCFGAVKAFYALPALAGFSALVGVGWDRVMARYRAIETAIWVLLLVWAATVYAAFWIRPKNPQVQIVRGLVLAEQQRYGEALEMLSLALRLDEEASKVGNGQLLTEARAHAHLTMGMIFDAQHEPAKAVLQYRAALVECPELDIALNNLAWMLASNPKIRDGSEAVRLAERACRLTQERQTVYIGTLAAAYAEAGRFSEAIATAQRAINCARLRGETSVAELNQQLWEFYKAGKALPKSE
jgi:4-amino-4-deoxy-L-arabinose transferase-like glycosyltransferase